MLLARISVVEFEKAGEDVCGVGAYNRSPSDAMGQIVTSSPTAPSERSESRQPSLVRSLSLLDAILLLVSGVIGSSIFLTAKDIAGPLPHPALFVLVWVVGGIV